MRGGTAIATAVFLVIMLALAVPPSSGATVVLHTVQPGENLFRISLRYGVTVEAIMQANGLVDPHRIQAGQILKIPVPTGTHPRAAPPKSVASATPAASAKAATPTKPASGAPDAAGTYVVQPGDTLYSIARRYGTTVEVLKAANNLRSDVIYVGQSLRIVSPGAAPPASAAPAAARSPLISSPQGPRRVLLARPDLGAEILTSQALRIRRGPKSYFTTLALVAPETRLRVIGEVGGWYEVQLPDGQTGWVDGDELRVIERPPSVNPSLVHGVDVVRDAMRYLGTPYLWGGETSRGVDCSGFVYIVLGSHLPQLARLRSFDYFQRGTPVERADLLPGDLVFFTTYAPGPSHVGIYIGDGNFIHASSGARRVVISSLDDRYYAARYLGARRLLSP